MLAQFNITPTVQKSKTDGFAFTLTHINKIRKKNRSVDTGL